MEEHFLGIESNETSVIKDESSYNNDFEIDILEDTLKHIFSRSKIRKRLAHILAIFYKTPLLIILISLLFGAIFLGFPILLIYLKIFDNFIIPICFIILLALMLYLINFLIRIIDDTKNKIRIIDKWERKNLINYFGIILTLIILIFGGFYLLDFFGNIINYNKEEKLKIIYEPKKEEEIDDKDKTSINDFIIKYIINCFLLNVDKIEKEESKVANFISDYSIIKGLIKKLCRCFKPLLIYSFIKIIQTIFIKVKYTIPKTIIFLSSFGFSILIIIMYYEYQVEKENFLMSLFEIVLITFFFLGYLAWSFCSIWRIYKNPKDKNFAINKYEFNQLIFIYIFELVNIIGSSLIYISCLISYINFINKKETFHYLKLTLLFLKVGFAFITLSYSYYYGHNFLSLIFRPIALQYAPVKLKKNYVRSNRNLSSYIFLF